MSEYIDPSVLASLAQFLDKDKQINLMQRYLADSEQLIEQLQQAIQSNNAEDARRMVHSLKSTSANVGAMPLSALSKELEQLASEAKLDEVQGRVDELSSCFENTRDAIQQMDIMQ